MTDLEIYKTCETEEGCVEYISKTIANNKGYYDWCYLPSDKVPVLSKLLDDGVIEKRIATGVEEWRVV